MMYNRLMRLDKLLANSGYGTRSKVRDLISSGAVTVNGVQIKDPGYKTETGDQVKINGESFGGREHIYLVFDKPDEVLTAMEDKRYKCVGDYIPQDLKGKHLSPVGRLDYHTTGLLIITNDGDLNHKLTSPRYKIPKTYEVTYQGDPLTDIIAEELSRGITLRDTDECVKLAPCTLINAVNNTCTITLTEGKTHEVRRIISHYGRQVITLRRISVADLRLNEANPGMLREMTDDELQLLLDRL